VVSAVTQESKLKLHAFKKTRITLAVWSLIVNLSPTISSAQTSPAKAWALLEAGLGEKSVGQRVAAVRVLSLIPNDPHAAELAEKALKDPSSSVRAGAATALGQMHASGADAALKEALKDKQLPVVMAAAHALRLLNDPACYEVYYAVFTGERKDDSSMVSQELKVLHDPKQVAEMGFDEGIGYVPFAGIPWEALETIMKDRKDGAAAKAALISALATDPDVRTNKVLVGASQNPNWVLRVAALEAIAKRGDPSLLPNIEHALGDSKREVKYTGAATIVRLSDVAKTREAATKPALTSQLVSTEDPE
jgi:HEAT repeat protein